MYLLFYLINKLFISRHKMEKIQYHRDKIRFLSFQSSCLYKRVLQNTYKNSKKMVVIIKDAMKASNHLRD